MSGTWPSNIGFAASSLSSIERALSSLAHNSRRFVRKHGSGHQWGFSVRTRNLPESDWPAVFAFLAAQEGNYETFSIVHPAYATARGVATGTPLVVGAGQTGTSLVTDGWTPSITGIMKAGDVIKIAGNNKVYMLTADADSTVSGVATLSIYPALVASPGDNAAVTVNAVPFTVALANPGEIDFRPPIKARVSFDVVEVIA